VAEVGKGLSSLQRDILEILERFKLPRKCRQPSTWMVIVWVFSIAKLARPKDIIEAFGRKNTASDRVAVSKALARLIARGLVDGYSGLLAQGRGYRYSSRTRV
jgi:hypothetical protein